MIHLIVHVEEQYRDSIESRKFFEGMDFKSCSDEHVFFSTGNSKPVVELADLITETVLWPVGPTPQDIEDDEEFFIPSKSQYQLFAWVCPWFRENKERLKKEPVIISGGFFIDCFLSMETVLEHLGVRYQVMAIF